MNKNKKSGAVACFSAGTAVLCFAGTLVLFVTRPPKHPEPETAGEIDEEALPVVAVG